MVKYLIFQNFLSMEFCHNLFRIAIVKFVKGKYEELGCGKIVVKAAFKKVTKKTPERIEITVELTPDYQKDYEIIPFHRDEGENQKAIEAFMAKYITKPFEYSSPKSLSRA